MLLLQSAITVYFYRIWVESTPHSISLTPILVTGAQSSNWKKIWKWLLLFRAKALTRRRKRRKKERQLQSVLRYTQNIMIGKRLVEWKMWFLIYFPTKHYRNWIYTSPISFNTLSWYPKSSVTHIESCLIPIWQDLMYRQSNRGKSFNNIFSYAGQISGVTLCLFRWKFNTVPC